MVETRFDSTSRTIQDHSQFLGGKVPQVVQHEYLSVMLWQKLQRLMQCFCFHGFEGLRRLFLSLLLKRIHRQLFNNFLTNEASRFVASNLVNPYVKGFRDLKRTQSTKCVNPDLLMNIEAIR